MSSNSSSNNKRIRRDDTRNNVQLQLSDLPQGILPKVASYLSNTSCVSFAISLFDPPTSQEPSIMSKAIINASVEGWDILDFKDIQDVYGRNLTDDDIWWILLCIDGVNKIKSLKFTNCIGITGSGLQRLTGSTVLKRIDLSLVGDYENPTITPEPPISVELVVPILNSIIEREDNVFEHVQLPKKWRVERSDLLTQFLQRFDEVLNGRRFPCSGLGCDEICENIEDEHEPFTLVWWQEGPHIGYERYGMVALSCYQCKKNLCGICEYNSNISFCKTCEKYYCEKCNDVEFCQGSNCLSGLQASSCKSCDVVKFCYTCGMSYCPDCVPTWAACQFCEENCCEDCIQNCCMNICQGDGCDRANCSGINSRGRYIKDHDCTNDYLEEPECVKDRDRECKDDEENHFCGDCWEKNRGGIEEGNE